MIHALSPTRLILLQIMYTFNVYIMMNVDDIQGFDWDDGNRTKEMHSHGVSTQELEQIFFNTPLIINQDSNNSSHTETRFAALGKTDEGRQLAIFFTAGSKLVRVISARSMSKKEQKVYHEKTKDNS